MSKHSFGKFMQSSDTGAKKKERIRQEKKKVRQETKEYFEQKKDEARQMRAQGGGRSGQARGEGGEQSGGYQGKRGFKGRSADQRGGYSKPAKSGYGKSSEDKPAFKRSGNDKPAFKRSRSNDDKPAFKKSRFNDDKPAFKRSRSNDDKPSFKKSRFSDDKPAFKTSRSNDDKPSPKRSRSTDDKPSFKKSRFSDDKPSFKTSRSNDDKPSFKKSRSNDDQSSPKRSRSNDDKPSFNRSSDNKPAFQNSDNDNPAHKSHSNNTKPTSKTNPSSQHKPTLQKSKPAETKSTSSKTENADAPASKASGSMPLNKYIAHAGICSRRDAADMVRAGKVQVNNERITEPGHKVTSNDEVKVNGKKIGIRRNLVYILLNKPKDYITTTEDPQGRKTVLDIVAQATPERVYPIGRLDRNTTGVLLLTNDGELAQKLSHPSYEVRKIYEVKLDKPLVKKDFDAVLAGVTLEDGIIAPDALAYADPKDKSVIGIEIHSGRNRIVRRIFEHIGYDVRNLDRVMYANLTKKNVDRGKWRFLNDKEIRLLKFLNKSYTKNR